MIKVFSEDIMKELKTGDRVSLNNGKEATILKELGRGGQGIVFLVDLAGKQMALKWYLHPMDYYFYNNLEENIFKGAPSEAFLWPEYITKKENDSFGYIMKLRPDGYYEFGQYLLAKRRFGSFEAVLNAAMKICDGFYKLHLSGLSYQDLNDGNFFIEPNTGDVLICDNDNVMPDGQRSGIMGKARYMAPEVVNGQAPDKYSDRFSLAVILFMLLYGNHPLEGARVLACPCMTELFEKKFYGDEAMFVYDDACAENRPVRGVHNNVIRRWPAFPAILRETFKEQFKKDVLFAPEKRMIEKKWKGVIQALRDMLVICPKCGEETFAQDADNATCMICGKSLSVGRLVFGNGRQILLTPNTAVYINDDIQPEIKVISVPDPKYPVQLQNITKDNWVVETQTGKIKQIEPGGCVPVRPGLKISFGSLKAIIK